MQYVVFWCIYIFFCLFFNLQQYRILKFAEHTVCVIVRFRCCNTVCNIKKKIRIYIYKYTKSIFKVGLSTKYLIEICIYYNIDTYLHIYYFAIEIHLCFLLYLSNNLYLCSAICVFYINYLFCISQLCRSHYYFLFHYFSCVISFLTRVEL